MAKHPAAFINAIAEEGTKEEAIFFLQKTWDELCDLKEKVNAISLGLGHITDGSKDKAK